MKQSRAKPNISRTTVLLDSTVGLKVKIQWYRFSD